MTTDRPLIVDYYGTCHTRSTCPEFHAPARGAIPMGTPPWVICADCEPERGDA